MKQEDVFNNYYFRINKRLLMNVYLWPYQNRSLKLFWRTFIVVAIHSMMIPQIIRTIDEIYAEKKNPDVIAENVSGLLYFEAVLSKYCAYILREKKLTYFYEEITKDLDRITNSEERSVMLRTWKIGRLMTVLYAGYTFTGCVAFVFAPTVFPAMFDLIMPLNVSRPKVLCYYAEYYIDQQEYFPYLLMHTFIAVSCTILIVAAIDSTYVGIVYHSLALFNVLKYRMTQIFKEVRYEYVADVKKADDIHKYVADSIKLHIKIINLVDNIQECFTMVFLIVTGCLLLALSIGTIDLVMNLNNTTNLIRIGFVWVGVIMYLFYTSWPAQQLIDQSQSLADEIYSSGWYHLPPKTRFYIKFMMMRCSIPCQLTAGPLLQMNFATCGLILKTSLSYFTVMASFS